jgi:hypothetical protein
MTSFNPQKMPLTWPLAFQQVLQNAPEESWLSVLPSPWKRWQDSATNTTRGDAVAQQRQWGFFLKAVKLHGHPCKAVLDQWKSRAEILESESGWTIKISWKEIARRDTILQALLEQA